MAKKGVVDNIISSRDSPLIWGSSSTDYCSLEPLARQNDLPMDVQNYNHIAFSRKRFKGANANHYCHKKLLILGCSREIKNEEN